MNEEQKPWYREPYVWLLIAFPLTAVIGGIITVALAIVSDDGLVKDDYYREGLEINRVLKRDRKATELELQASLQFSPGHDHLRLFLSGNSKYRAPDAVQISFLHSTRSGFDRIYNVSRDDNMYNIMFPPLNRGNWYIQIEADDWRLLESVTIR